MALNQLLQLGQLNRLRSSIRFPNFSQLNITAPFMTKAGIRYTQSGDGVVHLPAMIGTVPSLEPYVMVEITAALLKTLGLAGAFQAQQQLNSFLGPATVRPDTTSGLGQYNLQNITIVNPREQDFAGGDAAYPLLLRGYFPINSSIYP
jgi:hypothetical protein